MRRLPRSWYFLHLLYIRIHINFHHSNFLYWRKADVQSIFGIWPGWESSSDILLDNKIVICLLWIWVFMFKWCHESKLPFYFLKGYSKRELFVFNINFIEYIAIANDVDRLVLLKVERLMKMGLDFWVLIEELRGKRNFCSFGLMPIN